MPEYLSPGVYIEEVKTGPRPIEGVGTACAAFVGFAPAGPANVPELITSWSQYVQVFGKKLREPRENEPDEDVPRDPHMKDVFLSHAVYGYFQNGGGRCYVTRVLPIGQQATPPTLQLPSRASKDTPAFTLSVKDPAVTAINVEVAQPTGDPPPEGVFTLKISGGGIEEVYDNVTPNKRGPKNIVEEVNSKSRLVAVAEATTGGAVADRIPEFRTYTLELVQPESVALAKTSDLIGDVEQRSGVVGMEIAEDVTMLCCPDLMSPMLHKGDTDNSLIRAVQDAMVTHCYQMADRMAILDTPRGLKPKDVRTWRLTNAGFDAEAAKFAALYYPWLKVRVSSAELGGDTEIEIPPCGHIAGIYARTDRERGVHKAPANVGVLGIQGVSYQLTKAEQDTLNPDEVNCIRVFPGQGPLVWGARTLSKNASWRYVNVRRLFNFVEKSIERGTQWVVFEPNDPNLWARVRRDVGAFLTVCWRDGMLYGLTPAEAFFVKCDAELNPPEVRDQGKLIVEVGIAPIKPAEFVIFRFSQYVNGT